MSTLFGSQLDFVYCFYSLSFILLTAACWLLIRAQSQALSWTALGLFGILHGLNKLQDMAGLSVPESTWFGTLRLLTLAASYLCLIEFGRRNHLRLLGADASVGRWVPIVLTGIAGLAGVTLGLPEFSACVRYALGFPGAAWAAVVLLLAARRAQVGARQLALAGWLMAAFAVLVGLIVPRCDLFPATFVNQEAFLRLTHVPVPAVRGVVSVVFAAVIWRYYDVLCLARNPEAEPHHAIGHKLLWYTILAALLALGWAATQFIGKVRDTEERRILRNHARVAAAGIAPEEVRQLSGRTNDIGTPVYESLKKSLLAMRNVEFSCRFLYLMAMRSNTVIFLADSELPASPDYSPPGQVYSEALPAVPAMFRTALPLVIGPWSDHWGTWVSGFAPIKDVAAQRVTAVLGMDVDVQDWQRRIALFRLAPISVTLLVAVLLVVFYMARQTERESGLRVEASERRYRTLFNSGGDANVIHDLDGRLLEVNQVLCRRLGYSREHLLTMTLPQITAPAFVADANACLARLPRELRVTFETAHLTRDGQLVPIEVNATLIEYGGRTAIMSDCRDMTERNRTQQALLDSERRNRAIISALPDLMFRLQRDSTCIDCYAPDPSHLYLRVEQFLGKRLNDVLPPDIARRNAEAIARTLQSGEMQVFEYELSHADVLRSYEARMVVSGADEVLAIVRDITERRALEEEFLRAQKLESVGLLAGGIAHDFNNILMAILGNLQLARQLGGASREEADVLLQEAENATLRAQHLTQQLLTFAKGGAPVKQAASLRDIVKETAAFALHGSAARCVYELPADLWPVEVDPGQISQVIQNIVINADQAMPGGGTITIRAENVEYTGVPALPLEPGAYVVLAITDTGAGIPEKHLDKIFDPYFTTKEKGRGLGLTSTFSIVRKHGGHIVAESALGHGTTFRVYLPAARERAAATPQPPPRALAGTGRVLAMDDDVAICRVVTRVLESGGYSVQAAYDGAEAVALYAAALRDGRRFDAVLLDLTVPGGMGGKEAFEQLRALDPAVVAIVTSGYSNDPVMAEHARYGFAGVVAKPYRNEELLGVLHTALDKARRV